LLTMASIDSYSLRLRIQTRTLLVTKLILTCRVLPIPFFLSITHIDKDNLQQITCQLLLSVPHNVYCNLPFAFAALPFCFCLTGFSTTLSHTTAPLFVSPDCACADPAVLLRGAAVLHSVVCLAQCVVECV
jgi:hypothetical protein